MNSQQFAHSWNEIKRHLSARWDKVTEQDLHRINGDQNTFNAVVKAHYGAMHEEVSKWAHRWFCHWSGQYAGYEEASASLPKN
jgi:hypothetical protein